MLYREVSLLQRSNWMQMVQTRMLFFHRGPKSARASAVVTAPDGFYSRIQSYIMTVLKGNWVQVANASHGCDGLWQCGHYSKKLMSILATYCLHQVLISFPLTPPQWDHHPATWWLNPAPCTWSLHLRPCRRSQKQHDILQGWEDNRMTWTEVRE